MPMPVLSESLIIMIMKAQNLAGGSYMLQIIDSNITFFRRQEDYEVLRKIGRGKYSEVFEGVNINSGQKCVVKILKPSKNN